MKKIKILKSLIDDEVCWSSEPAMVVCRQNYKKLGVLVGLHIGPRQLYKLWRKLWKEFLFFYFFRTSINNIDIKITKKI